MTAPSQRHGMYGESSRPSTMRHARKATIGTTRSGAVADTAPTVPTTLDWPAMTEQMVRDIAVENPATGEVIAHVPDLTPEQVAELARAARAAQPAWEALG